MEKVIKGLETCKSSDETCFDCPYNGEICTTSLCDDILALLKEKESIIESLESDLHETLEVVSGRLNVVRCKDCINCIKEPNGV